MSDAVARARIPSPLKEKILKLQSIYKQEKSAMQQQIDDLKRQLQNVQQEKEDLAAELTEEKEISQVLQEDLEREKKTVGNLKHKVCRK